MYVHPESFVTTSITVEQELRGAGACDTCCDRTVGQDWMNDHVHSLKRLKLKYWTLSCQERLKFGTGVPALCKTACFIPVLIYGACAVVRVFRGARNIDAADWQRHAESVGSTI